MYISKETHKKLKVLLTLLTWVAIPIMLVYTIFAPFSCMDAQITVELFEKSTCNPGGRDQMCQYPGCNHEAEHNFYSWLGDSRDQEKIALGVENKANFTIITQPYNATKSFDLHDTEDVYGVGYLGGGTFVVTKGEIQTVEHVTIQDGVKYETEISGYYCSNHMGSALSTIKQEVRDYFIGNDFNYFWGVVMSPYNYVILIALFICMFALYWYVCMMWEPKEKESKPESKPQPESIPETPKKEEYSAPAAPKFDANKIPAWKRVQMEQEGKK